MSQDTVEIPMDIYESEDEIVLLTPLGGVEKTSIDITLEKTNLIIKGTRKIPELKENMMSLQEESYWGEFIKKVELPQNVYFDQIHSSLSKENILIIIVPKIKIPDKIKVEIQGEKGKSKK